MLSSLSITPEYLPIYSLHSSQLRYIALSMTKMEMEAVRSGRGCQVILPNWD